MISLRTMEGCDLGVVQERFGPEEVQILKKQAARYIREGMIKVTDEPTAGPDAGLKGNNRLILTREGKLLADGIAAELFFDAAKD
jgi:oxygen-independent coproporphyrinogen-3 oxidase